jgi:NAD(P)H-dependent FMN reductase
VFAICGSNGSETQAWKRDCDRNEIDRTSPVAQTVPWRIDLSAASPIPAVQENASMPFIPRAPVVPRILVFAGSVRTGAYSGRTADAAQKELAFQGAEVTRIALADYPLPIFDADLEREQGVPANALKLAGQIAAHDGVLIATPEYNGSIPPLLKNTIDWVSRVRGAGAGGGGRPLADKAAGLCSSSSGRFAGVRAVNHLRAVLVRCGMAVVTPECSVPEGAGAFDANGDFTDPKLRQAMEHLCRTLIEAACLTSTRVEP